MANHKLLLSMYVFQLKKRNGNNADLLTTDDFLSSVYSEKNNYFADGFAMDFKRIIGNNVIKTNTHGGRLAQYEINGDDKYLDIMLDGGLTGIQQFIIDDLGNIKDISSEDIVGLKFFARIWLPSSSTNFYVFVQRYSDLNIKKLFDHILNLLFSENDYSIANRYLKATTTKVRQEKFLENSSLKEITILSKKSSSETSIADSSSASLKIRLKKGLFNIRNIFTRDKISEIAQEHGFELGERSYIIKATYENDENGNEQRTRVLDSSEDSINIIPNIVIRPDCIDAKNYPIFKKLQRFIDEEISIIKNEVGM